MIDPVHAARLIEDADVKGLAALLDTLTPTPLSLSARGLVLGPDLVLRLTGVNVIASDLVRGLDPPQGGALAEAVLTVGLAHLADPARNPALFAEGAAHAASSLALAYAHAGRHGDIVALSDEMQALLGGRTDGTWLATLRLSAIDALIALNRLEEAERALNALEAAGCTNPSLPFTRERLAERLRSATTLADTRSADRRAQDAFRATNVAAAKALRSLLVGEYPELAAGLDALVGQAQSEKPVADAWAAFNRSSAMRRQLAGQVGLEGSELFSWKTRVEDAVLAFRDGGGHDPTRLGPALQTFRAAIDWFDAHGEREEGHHARWCAYIAERRLGHPGAALDVLEDLATRLERDRASIVDRLRRAGQRAAFPMLPAAMVECADMLDDPRRMLAAIEAAKGRALADLRTAADGATFDEAELHVTPEAASDLVARLGIGYASYLAIDNAVFAVAVWPDGTWHRARIPLDVAARSALSVRIEPLTWVVPTRPAAFDLGSALAPLTDWLLKLLPALPAGGHLVLSPDAELHQWPLHMATTPAGPLGLTVGVSRIHGIDALRRLAASLPTRPRRAVAVHIPARDEAEPTAKARGMNRTVAALPSPVIIPPERADAGCFATLDASDAILHLNAHGVFPETRLVGGMDPNPYRSAGLLLAHQGALPERSAAWPHRLTPALLLESPGLKLHGATVVLQGCVSGLAKEGQGGDALGLEWALLARGVDTVLASHWYVDYRSAGAFCQRFYKAWLGRGSSRIAAWQEAVARTRQNPNGGPPYDWAAFSLSGDWR